MIIRRNIGNWNISNTLTHYDINYSLTMAVVGTNMNKPMDRSQLTSHHDKFLLTIIYPLVAKRGNGKMPRIRSLNKYDEIWEDHL